MPADGTAEETMTFALLPRSIEPCDFYMMLSHEATNIERGKSIS